ncbi:MAG: AMP-binding protein, partial [Candidatus Tectomicrobia bacterium]|nr:AMP-binding protein [Candidatus Tectomicrobia bacterium]
NGLLNLGINKGDRESALKYNCHQFMEIYFSLAKIGAIMFPLNFRLVARELLFALDDSGSDTLLIGPEFAHLRAHL